MLPQFRNLLFSAVRCPSTRATHSDARQCRFHFAMLLTVHSYFENLYSPIKCSHINTYQTHTELLSVLSSSSHQFKEGMLFSGDAYIE